uniref:Facilitated trehalose transporter Tret1-like n=1 Tax=Diabrotica virgifera virgifera TaxID=50390 RepID=A0A6P7FY56_DIAVI
MGNLKNEPEKKIDQQEINYVPFGTENIQLKPENEPKQVDTLYMYFAVLTCQLIVFVAGGAAVWTSPTIPILLSNNTHINPLSEPITPVQTSMLVGFPNFLSIVGCLFFPKLSDVIGRKNFLQVMSILIFVSGILLAFSKEVSLLIAARSISCIFYTASFTVISVYISEISEDFQRAKFGCFLGAFHQIGHFYCYVIGPFFNINLLTILIVFPTIIFFVLAFFLPESPTFCLLKKREVQCMKSLSKLRSYKTQKELESDMSKIDQVIKVSSDQKSLKYLFKTKENRVGFMLGLLPCIAQQSSGISAIMIFLAPIFNSAGTRFSGNHVAMIVGMVKMITFTFTSFVVERVGRRRMLLFSSVGTSMSLFFLGLFFFLKHLESPIVAHLQWLPFVSVISLVFMYSLGLGPIPVGIMNELFAPNYRAAASSLVMALAMIVVTIITAAYPLVAQTFGPHWCILMFSFLCLGGSTMMFIYLPETKGMSLNEIQEMLKKY